MKQPAKNYDFIVIGSGISGLNFALRAAEKNYRVLVVTKKRIAESGTNFAQGGIAAVLSKVDDYKTHVNDTLVAGAFHNDRRAVSYMVKHGPAAIERLIELGVPFAMEEGAPSPTFRAKSEVGRVNGLGHPRLGTASGHSLTSLRLGLEGGHSRRRIAFVSDYTGQAIEKVLVEKTKKSKHITLFEHTFAVDLLIKNKRCYGVQLLRGRKLNNVYAQTVVLATGGIGQLYAHTTNPAISTGDGLAMALRAGCLFKDLEFVQFHPTALSVKGAPRFLISEAVRGEGAVLRNVNGEEFMKKYHPRAELAPRDIVSRAIFEEEKNGPVFLDLRHKKAACIKMRFPQIYQTLRKYGIDMARELVPITPAAHYSCGGIKVNLKGETGIKNLYAFGEVTCTGVHGANRLASNSLLEALVFSDRILSLPIKAKTLKKISHFKLPPMRFNKNFTTRIKKIRQTLRRIMWDNVGIVRSKSSLRSALRGIEILKKEAGALGSTNQELLELKNMIGAASLITQAAQKRKKSLGCHYRVD